MIPDEILRTFDGKSALVTGGTGLIGRQVVRILADAGARVTIVSLDQVEVDPRAEHVIGDITFFEFCRSIAKDRDFVLHLAGIKGSADITHKQIASHFVPTVMMNTNMLEAARMNKVPKVVYTSSIGAYASADIFREETYRLDSEPMDFAGWAKRMAELQVYAYKVQHGLENFAVVRPANVYGPGDSFNPANAMVIPTLMNRIHRKENPVVIWGDGSAVRDFAYSRDVAEGVLLALHHGTRGTFANLGSGVGVSIKQLVETLRSFIDFNYEFDTSKSAGFPVRVMDITRAREWLGYEPATSLRDGLEETWKWFLANDKEYLRKKNYFEDYA